MTRLFAVITLCAIIPFVAPQCNVKTARPSFSRSVYEFSANLLRRLVEDTEGHFVSSTLSPWTLLTAASYGAADETLSQLKKTLHHNKVECFNNKYLQIAKQITSSDESATLERASAIFIDNTVVLNEGFRTKVANTGVCEVSPISFDDFSGAAQRINDYVKSATHGIIEEIVSPNDLEGVYLMLVDALYFKGTWRTAFAVENTETSGFFDSKGNHIGDVNFMFVNSQFNITSIEAIKATVLELPYGQNGRYSMLIFLPNEGVTLTQMTENLMKISLLSVFLEFKRNGPQTVMVQVPRFKIKSDLSNLKEFLVDMGLTDMFDVSYARFPYLSNYDLYVSSFIQKADIEVTETGTVAAAVTDMGFSYRSSILTEEFIANKPFLFMVVDKETEVAVFTGAYSKPSLY